MGHIIRRKPADIHSTVQQITNGIAVIDASETPNRDRTRIGLARKPPIDLRFNPTQKQASVCIAKRRIALGWRHRVRTQAIRDYVQSCDVAHRWSKGRRCIGRQIEPAFRRSTAVATDAVSSEHRQNARRKFIGRTDGRRNHP